MTVATFLASINASRKDGKLPKRVDLSLDDAAELRAEVMAKPVPKRCCCACHQHEPRQVTSGYVMTLAGVDVFVKGEQG